MPSKQKHECDPRTRCRVRDVLRVHHVRIPLTVFQELGIAGCWVDWVDLQDVALALNHVPSDCTAPTYEDIDTA